MRIVPEVHPAQEAPAPTVAEQALAIYWRVRARTGSEEAAVLAADGFVEEEAQKRRAERLAAPLAGLVSLADVQPVEF